MMEGEGSQGQLNGKISPNAGPLTIPGSVDTLRPTVGASEPAHPSGLGPPEPPHPFGLRPPEPPPICLGWGPQNHPIHLGWGPLAHCQDTDNR